jgi:hypothetical protein
VISDDEDNYCHPEGMPSDDPDPVVPATQDTATPAEDVSPSGEDAAGPAEDVVTPEEDVTTPEEDVTTPAEDATTPAEDATTPAEDVTTPAEDIATPEEDVATPEDDTEETSDFAGSTPEDCGAPGQGLEPIDCTAYGDADAVCVFSNHCMCSDGFACEANYPGTPGPECAAGSACYTAGTMPTSCGSPDQGVETVDCTASGDLNATCVFGDHCMCGEGFVCEELASAGMPVEECAAGSGCVPAPDM